jgi:hypothetical protein
MPLRYREIPRSQLATKNSDRDGQSLRTIRPIVSGPYPDWPIGPSRVNLARGRGPGSFLSIGAAFF